MMKVSAMRHRAAVALISWRSSELRWWLPLPPWHSHMSASSFQCSDGMAKIRSRGTNEASVRSSSNEVLHSLHQSDESADSGGIG